MAFKFRLSKRRFTIVYNIVYKPIVYKPKAMPSPQTFVPIWTFEGGVVEENNTKKTWEPPNKKRRTT
jgi:hypothetical protein